MEPYVLRYWETEFKVIKPIRTKADQRLYRRKDVEALLTIKDLLYEKRYTIRGARKYLLRHKAEKEPAEFYHGLLVEIKSSLLSIKRIMDR